MADGMPHIRGRSLPLLVLLEAAQLSDTIGTGSGRAGVQSGSQQAVYFHLPTCQGMLTGDIDPVACNSTVVSPVPAS